jgi:hypothetical protein
LRTPSPKIPLTHRSHLAAGLLALLVACGSPTDETGTDTDPGPTLPTLEGPDLVAFDGSNGAVGVVDATLSTSDGFFNFDPTLDVTLTADENAEEVNVEVSVNLSECSDASVSLDGSTNTVTFTTPCDFNDVSVEGTVTIDITGGTGTLTALVTFEDVVIDDTYTVDGTLAT